MIDYILIGIFILIYFLPSFIANKRKHKNLDPIFIVNLVLGWTIWGWLVAFVWSFTSNTAYNNSTQEH